MKNKVNKKHVLEALEYFFTCGMIYELKSDERLYVKALLNEVANYHNIKLKWKNNDI